MSPRSISSTRLWAQASSNARAAGRRGVVLVGQRAAPPRGVSATAVVNDRVTLVPGATRDRPPQREHRVEHRPDGARQPAASARPGRPGVRRRPRNLARSVSYSVGPTCAASVETTWTAHTGFWLGRPRPPPAEQRVPLRQPLGLEEQLAERRVGQVGPRVVSTTSA